MWRCLSTYVRTHALDVFSGVQGSALRTPALWRTLFRMAGYRCGREVRIMHGVYVGSRDLHIGSRVLVGARSHLGGAGHLMT